MNSGPFVSPRPLLRGLAWSLALSAGFVGLLFFVGRRLAWSPPWVPEPAAPRSSLEPAAPSSLVDRREDEPQGALELPEPAQARAAPLAPLTPAELEPFSAAPSGIALELERWVAEEATPEGLWNATVDLWAQDEFDLLTAEERSRLLPLDDGLTSAPGRLRDLFGGLPTLEDVQRAYQVPEVRAAHAAWAHLELVIGELQEVPRSRRSEGFEPTLRSLRAAREAAYLELARALEPASGYRHWSELARLYLAWCHAGEGPWIPPAGESADGDR